MLQVHCIHFQLSCLQKIYRLLFWFVCDCCRFIGIQMRSSQQGPWDCRLCFCSRIQNITVRIVEIVRFLLHHAASLEALHQLWRCQQGHLVLLLDHGRWSQVACWTPWWLGTFETCLWTQLHSGKSGSYGKTLFHIFDVYLFSLSSRPSSGDVFVCPGSLSTMSQQPGPWRMLRRIVSSSLLRPKSRLRLREIWQREGMKGKICLCFLCQHLQFSVSLPVMSCIFCICIVVFEFCRKLPILRSHLEHIGPWATMCRQVSIALSCHRCFHWPHHAVHTDARVKIMTSCWFMHFSDWLTLASFNQKVQPFAARWLWRERRRPRRRWPRRLQWRCQPSRRQWRRCQPRKREWRTTPWNLWRCPGAHGIRWRRRRCEQVRRLRRNLPRSAGLCTPSVVWVRRRRSVSGTKTWMNVWGNGWRLWTTTSAFANHRHAHAKSGSRPVWRNVDGCCWRWSWHTGQVDGWRLSLMSCRICRASWMCDASDRSLKKSIASLVQASLIFVRSRCIRSKFVSVVGSNQFLECDSNVSW